MSSDSARAGLREQAAPEHRAAAFAPHVETPGEVRIGCGPGEFKADVGLKDQSILGDLDGLSGVAKRKLRRSPGVMTSLGAVMLPGVSSDRAPVAVGLSADCRTRRLRAGGSSVWW